MIVLALAAAGLIAGGQAGAATSLAPVPPATSSSSQILQSVIDAYAEARGGWDALTAIQSVTYIDYLEPDPYGRRRVMIKTRSGGFMVGCLRPTCSFAEGVDEAGAWEANPGTGRVRRVRGEASRALLRTREIYDPLLRREDSALQLTLLGEQTVEGRPVWAVRVVEGDGLESTAYVDRETRLLLGLRRAVPVHARGEHIDQLTVFSDWRRHDGVLFPHTLYVRDMRPGMGNIMEPASTWDSIFTNWPYPDSYFSPAHLVPTPAARLVLDIYENAADPADVRARHRAFRQSPDGQANLANDLNWLGYEFLKSDDTARAIAAFELALEEYPGANAWDSLGDAYLAAGQEQKALAAFEQALSLEPDNRGARHKAEGLRRRLLCAENGGCDRD